MRGDSPPSGCRIARRALAIAVATTLAVLAGGGAPAAHASTAAARLRPVPLAAEAEFGYSVALAAGRVVVGAPGERGAAGAAYAFACTAAGCAAPQRMAPADTVPGDRYGSAIAASADTVAVAAPGHSAGVVYVYVLVAGVPQLQARLDSPAAVAGGRFGSALALEGDRLAVGAEVAGSAWVYTRTAGVWGPPQMAMRLGGTPRDRYGAALALAGDTLVVGAPLEAASGVSSSYARGAAYVFVQNGGAWQQQARLSASGAADGDLFGLSLALLGDRVAVAAPAALGLRGRVSVFERSGANWQPVAELGPAAAVAGDRFGWSLALANDRIVAGSPLAAETCGASTQFLRSGAAWVESPPSRGTPMQPGALQGWAVAALGAATLVAMPDFNSGGAPIAGQVSWYEPAAGAYGDGFEPGIEACMPAP